MRVDASAGVAERDNADVSSPTCCGGPTSRCTPPRTPTRASSSTSRGSTRPTAPGSRRSRTSTPRWSHRQFVLHYQPKIDVETGAAFGAEALVRWEHPTRGLLYPDAFLPVVEQSGL